MELQGKRVLVFGSGKSGIGAADLLAKVGAVPVIFDGNAEIDKEAVVLKMQDEFVTRISHTEPGNVKGFYKKFRADFNAKVNEIIEAIGKLN